MTTTTIDPGTAAHHAYDKFTSRAAGDRYRTNADVAASVILYMHLNKAQRALIASYVTRREYFGWCSEPARDANQQHINRQLLRDIETRHAELLLCLMVALLIPNDIDPNAIAPADYAGLADIAYARYRYDGATL